MKNGTQLKTNFIRVFQLDYDSKYNKYVDLTFKIYLLNRVIDWFQQRNVTVNTGYIYKIIFAYHKNKREQFDSIILFFSFSFCLSYKYKIFKGKYIGTEERKTKKHQEMLNQQRNRKSLVTGEIYDRLLAAEIDSLSKLIRNGIFSFSHFVVCFSYLKVFHRVAWCLLFTQRFSIILIPYGHVFRNI